jgi:hypothetical protein
MFLGGHSPDTLYQKALNPDVPDDEQRDAQLELTKPYANSSGWDTSMKAMADQIAEMVQSGEMEKAYFQSSASTGLSRRSATHGDYVETYSGWVRTDGRIERPMAVNFKILQKIGGEIPILQAVVALRRRQIQAFASVPETDGQTGFQIVHKDKEHKITKGEQKITQVIADFILNSGFEEDARKRKKMGRDTLPEVLSAITEQSLIMDAVAIETEQNRRGDGFTGYYVADASMIRLIDPRMGYNKDKDIYFVEVDGKDMVRETFTLDQGFYYVRNPSSSILRYRYGTAETERLLRIMNGFMMALDYNSNNFNRNTIPKGFLQLFGSYDRKAIEQFKREFTAQMLGLKWRHGFPVLVAREKAAAAEWLRTGAEFNEMAFARWITFLVSVICALYGVSPEEINMDSFSTRTGGISGTDTAERIASAKDKGFKPYLRHIEQLYNQYVIPVLDGNYRLQFVGVDTRDEQRVAEQKKEVVTVDEQRAELGMEQHPDPIQGQSPVDQAHLQLYMQQPGVAGVPAEGEEGAPPEGEKGEAGLEGAEKAIEKPPEGKEETKKARNPVQSSRFDHLLRI